MKQNRFIIITPSYNNEEWVEYNISSILNQTYTNFKVLYIDDASADNTYQKVHSIVNDDARFMLIRNEENKGAAYNYVEYIDLISDDVNDILVHLDGDDWFFDDDVLLNLNKLYNDHDYWMTYGRFVCYDGSDVVTESTVYGVPHNEFVHDYKLYRRDMFKASHLRTYRSFLFKSIDKNDLKSLYTNEYYWHAIDVAWGSICQEMCPKDKIGVPDFFTCVYNMTPKNQVRSNERQAPENHKFEDEIRNRKRYKEGLSGEKLPLVNVIGDFRERNTIPNTFSYVYNQTDGEFDITLIQDMFIINYINGEIPINRGKIVADIHEPRHLLEHNTVYDLVLKNAEKFDLILTYDSDLLKLPNAVFRNGGYEVVLNKNVHTQTYPVLSDETLYKIYEKPKLVSFITSNKTITDGHKFRVSCVNLLRSNNLDIDIKGVGYDEITGKLEALQDYKFSVAIENGIGDNYFTEKILDCFLTGTIPIYKGCKNISEFFNIDGILTFETENDLVAIVNNLSDSDYLSRLEHIKDNFERAKQYAYNNDQLFEKYFKTLLV
jgi:glycosyltransferase involved in cell wall biosynthesis